MINGHKPKVLKKKVVLLGDSAVGKTSMVRRFVEDRYDDKYISTVGAKVSKKSVLLDTAEGSREIIMMIWDVIGTKGYVTAQSAQIANCECALLVHDLTRPETFDSLLTYWIPLMYKIRKGSMPPLMLAGNKADLVSVSAVPDEREIFPKIVAHNTSGQILSEIMPHPIGWRPTSARTGINVEDCFQVMAWMIFRPKEMPQDAPELEEEAGGMVWTSELDTLLSLCDLIVTEFPLLGKREDANFILERSFAKEGFDKDDPSAEELRVIIDMITQKAIEDGFNPEAVEEHKEKWLNILEDIEAGDMDKVRASMSLR